MSGTQGAKSPAPNGKRVPKENPNYAAQPGMKKTQLERKAGDRRNSISSAAADSPQRHGNPSPTQQTHDLSGLMRDLQARVVKVEATVVTLDGDRLTAMETKAVKLENELVTLRTDLVEARGIAVKRKEECGNLQVKLENELATLRTELVEVRGIAEKRKDECGKQQAANEVKVAALEEEVSSLKEKLKMETEERQTTDIGVGVLAGEVAKNGEKQKEELKRAEQQMDAVEGRKAEMEVILRKMVEIDVKIAEERTEAVKQVELKLEKQIKEVKYSVNRRSDKTAAKSVEPVESSDCLWEKKPEDGDVFVVLTDSNGAGVTQETIRRHIPREKQSGCRIRVYTTYTLFEAFSKIKDGKIMVEGARIVVDVATNDVRGTRGQPQTTPDELVDRVGKLVALLKEKGAVGVTVCEVKPMTLKDVRPYSDRLRQRCKENKIGWCRTQLGVSSLKEDGFHVLPSFLRVMNDTYAYAIMGVQVPNPTPTYQKWRHRMPEREWPQVGEERELNVWRRREEERRTRTQIP
jgi:hypothetical protein